MTSEERCGIIEQPPPTCPLIDRVKGDTLDALCCIKRICKGDTDEIRDLLDEMENLIDLAAEEMEDIRERVENIRAWRNEWKARAIDLDEDSPSFPGLTLASGGTTKYHKEEK